MVKALYYCHNVVKLIHRDIKPDNIMINHNDEAILIDFGLSTLLENGEITKSNFGTYKFFAPEMFQKRELREHGEHTDIWALGVTIFYMLTGIYPHEANELEVLISAVT